ncbi:MAG: family 20 glycosylhydrolase [Bacteroidota bacterium]
MRSFLRINLILVLFSFLSSCSEAPVMNIPRPTIIPQPQEMSLYEGYFYLDVNTQIYSPPGNEIAVSMLQNYLKDHFQLNLQETSKSEADIIFELDPSIQGPAEHYGLNIMNEKILIRSADVDGSFWAVQSLIQLLPIPQKEERLEDDFNITIPSLQVVDFPEFHYRGMHLDVGRHFFPKEFIKEYIAHLSVLKMNYFHWHLTEDQGWRIEILQYPNLTKHAAYREETLIGHYNDTPQQFDGKRYGGFYSQEDIKEIVAFAQEHNVTIIPEIEMPGHAQAAISAYPELGCTGEQVPVATKWGVFENIYCPKEETFTFLKNVLTEVMELFPGEYIHIGGDEAPKAHWKACDHCQKLISDLGLKDEHELQSYFIKEIESFVNSKGKKIIGWDEILEGGLAPNATVMSWRGTQGAIEAAQEGHDVILTPTSHAYFDYYQAEYEDEPLAIGGFLPLEKVYSFNPIPEELSAAESQYVLGAQGNVWTEYMPTTDQVEYMAFPRMLAMSEVVWKGPSEDLESDYPNFLSRVESFLPRMDVLDINYANHLYDVSGEVVKRNDSIFYALNSPVPNQIIYYSKNKEEALSVYTEPVYIDSRTVLNGFVHKLDGSQGRQHTAQINYHNGITGTISLNVDPHPAYGEGGKDALINGISGSNTRYGDKEWLGFWGDDLEITIDLGEEMNISNVSTRFYNANGQWIYGPKKIEIALLKELDSSIENEYENVPRFLVNDKKFTTINSKYSQKLARYVKLKVQNFGTIPQGMQGAGNKAWTFIDEIIIE